MTEDSISHVIPNWYLLPSGELGQAKERQRGLRLLYSGNMKDRIDWDLFRKLASISEDVELHLVGGANVVDPGFGSLLSYGNVSYHGPLSERETIQLLKRMDVAVMPHKVDTISAYMNPLKVHMYAAVGLHTVTTAVPGVSSSPLLHIAQDHGEFLRLVETVAQVERREIVECEDCESADTYIELIERVRRESRRGGGALFSALAEAEGAGEAASRRSDSELESSSQPAKDCAA